MAPLRDLIDFLIAISSSRKEGDGPGSSASSSHHSNATKSSFSSSLWTLFGSASSFVVDNGRRKVSELSTEPFNSTETLPNGFRGPSNRPSLSRSASLRYSTIMVSWMLSPPTRRPSVKKLMLVRL